MTTTNLCKLPPILFTGHWLNCLCVYVCMCTVCTIYTSGRASFWGDAYIVRKWTGNLRTRIRKCVPTKRSRETNASFQFSKICSSQTMRAYLSYTGVCSVIVCVMFCLRRVETEDRFFLRTLYASLPWICVQRDFYAYCTQKFALTRPLLDVTCLALYGNTSVCWSICANKRTWNTCLYLCKFIYRWSTNHVPIAFKLWLFT